MQVKNLSKNDWLGITGLIVGVLGIGISIYTYSASIKQREPIFEVAPARTEILNSRNAKDASITVLKKDGTKVVSDLTSIRFFFWNRGKEPIRKENVLRDITITLDDPKGKILDFRLLRTSRDVTSFSLSRVNDRVLKVNFNILENLDGATGQVIYEGEPEAKIVVSGVIEEVNSIKGIDSINEINLWKEYLKPFLFLFLAYFLLTLISQWVFYSPSQNSQVTRNRLLKVLLANLFISALSAFGLIVYFVVVGGMNDMKYRAIPSSILPESTSILSD